MFNAKYGKEQKTRVMEKCYKQILTELIIIKIVPNDSLYTVFTKNIFISSSQHRKTEIYK